MDAREPEQAEPPIARARAIIRGRTAPRTGREGVVVRSARNAGVWFVGRLQTDADRARVIERLVGSDGGAGLDEEDLRGPRSPASSRELVEFRLEIAYAIVADRR